MKQKALIQMANTQAKTLGLGFSMQWGMQVEWWGNPGDGWRSILSGAASSALSDIIEPWLATPAEFQGVGDPSGSEKEGHALG